jgi:hypothetical protein
MVYRQFGAEPWLMVPMLAQTLFLSPAGETRARLDVGARANYFLPQRPGPLLVDSDIQLLLDVPRISVGDVDGDGAPDVVGSGRHEVRVFRRKPDGSFDRAPSREYKLSRHRARPHPRLGLGARRGARRLGRRQARPPGLQRGRRPHRREVADALYLNRDGVWDLANPDFVSTRSPAGARTS